MPKYGIISQIRGGIVMASKNVPKKYMLVLQKRNGGQEAVEFTPSGDAYTVAIKSFTAEKLNYTTKKNSKVQKNTLAFYDALTNKFKNYDQFLAIVGQNIYPFDYKPATSYIGFLNNGYMNTVSLSFNDPLLAEIALKADGNNINKKDKNTISIVTDIVDLVEDPNSDFVEKLKNAFDLEDKRFNFSRSLVDKMITFRTAAKAMTTQNKYSHIMNDAIVEDLDVFKREFLLSIESYKNFRELYRFRKQYLYDKQLESSLVSTESKEERKPVVRTETLENESFEAYRQRYEEVRQKEYPRHKQKTLDSEIPGQMSVYDVLKTK